MNARYAVAVFLVLCGLINTGVMIDIIPTPPRVADFARSYGSVINLIAILLGLGFWYLGNKKEKAR